MIYNQIMIFTLLFFIYTLLILYALIAYVRRKVTKPQYQGKTVWITGGSSGLGQFMAYEYNRCGAYVILSARNINQLKRVQQGCAHPERAEIVKLDMTDFKQIEAVSRKVLQKLQREGRKLDVLVENAGISQRCLFQLSAFQNHLDLFQVNVNGPYRHLQVVLPHMIKNKSGQIIGITSLAGKTPASFRSSYSGAKAAFIAIMDSLRSELKPHGIRVCNIMPGYIKTNLSKNAFSAKAGERFGKMDTNIDQGMDAEQFAREAVAAAYNNQNELSISKHWANVFRLVLRTICPDLAFLLMFKNAKNQRQALENAKNQ